MRILSVCLEMDGAMNKNDFYTELRSWMGVNTIYSSLAAKMAEDVKHGTMQVRTEYTRIKGLEIEENGESCLAFRLSNKYYDQIWITEIFYIDKGEHCFVALNIDYMGDRNAFTVVPYQRCDIVRYFAKSKFAKQGELPFSETSAIVPDASTEEAIIETLKGERRLSRPLVYVSILSGTRGYEVDVDSLARRLAGIAYVVAEPNIEFSYSLKEKGCSIYPFNGYIGIYIPGEEVKIWKSRQGSRWDILEKKIALYIIKAITSRVSSEIPSWAELEAELTRKLSGEQQELLAVYEDENNTQTDKIKSASQRISDLMQENAELHARCTSLTEALSAREDNPVLMKRPEINEFFDGEIYDAILSALKIAEKYIEDETRLKEIVQSVLSQNEYQGNGKRIDESLRQILAKSSRLSDREFSELAKLGFDLVGDNNHYKIVYRNDPRYWFTVHKTSSDYKGPKNLVSDIIRKISVYKG